MDDDERDHDQTEDAATEGQQTQHPALQDPEADPTDPAAADHFTGESYRNALRLN